MKKKDSLSVGTWVSMSILGFFLLTGVSVWMAHAFSTKTELYLATGSNDVRDWRIHSLETRVGNLEKLTTRVDKNVDRLLIRFRVEAAPVPEFEPLPPKPPEAKKGK